LGKLKKQDVTAAAIVDRSFLPVKETKGSLKCISNYRFQLLVIAKARSNPLHNQVDGLAGDCFAKLRKARNDEHFL